MKHLSSFLMGLVISFTVFCSEQLSPKTFLVRLSNDSVAEFYVQDCKVFWKCTIGSIEQEELMFDFDDIKEVQPKIVQGVFDNIPNLSNVILSDEGSNEVNCFFTEFLKTEDGKSYFKEMYQTMQWNGNDWLLSEPVFTRRSWMIEPNSIENMLIVKRRCPLASLSSSNTTPKIDFDENEYGVIPGGDNNELILDSRGRLIVSSALSLVGSPVINRKTCIPTITPSKIAVSLVSSSLNERSSNFGSFR